MQQRIKINKLEIRIYKTIKTNKIYLNMVLIHNKTSNEMK